MNNRRKIIVVLGASALTLPLATFAQQPGKVWRIGFLNSESVAGYGNRVDAFRAGMRELGYEEGKNLVIDFRWAEGNNDRLPELAEELVRLKVDLLLTHATFPLRAAKNATTTIPIVFAVSADVVAMGFVESLARPGGNITGSIFFAFELAAKRIELLKDAIPRITRVAELAVLNNAARPMYHQAMEATARSAKVTLHEFAVRGPHEFDSAFAAMVKARVDAVVAPDYPSFVANAAALADLAAKHRLPLIGGGGFAEVGGLMSYGADINGLWRRAAYFVDKIFKGAKPADIPVEQATRFDLAINMKTAKALGIKIPNSILVRATTVVE
jgi:putative ABC transport system substrate-binding protein